MPAPAVSRYCAQVCQTLTLHGIVAQMCGDVGPLACPRRRACGCSALDVAMRVVLEAWSKVNIEC
jgi:hypothetical protein